MPTTTLSPDILNAAIEGLEQKKLHIESQVAELRALLSSSNHAHPTNALQSAPDKRKLSNDTLQRMSEGQQRRWARKNATSNSQDARKDVKSKRTMSATGRANIVAALKKRWAAKRAAEETAAKKNAKKA